MLHVLAPNEPTTGAPQAADLAQGLPAAVHPQGSLPQRPVQEGFWKGESAGVSTSAVPQGMQTSPTCSLAAATASSRFKTHLKTNVCLPFNLFANGFQRRSGGAFVRLAQIRCTLGLKLLLLFSASLPPGQDLLPHQGRWLPCARARPAKLPRVQGLHEEAPPHHRPQEHQGRAGEDSLLLQNQGRCLRSRPVFV